MQKYFTWAQQFNSAMIAEQDNESLEVSIQGILSEKEMLFSLDVNTINFNFVHHCTKNLSDACPAFCTMVYATERYSIMLLDSVNVRMFGKLSV